MKPTACRVSGCLVTAWLAAVSCLPAEVRINEVHHRPSPAAVLAGEDPARLEFLELYNPDSSPVDLSGWSLSSGVEFTFPGGTWLGPGEYLVVARDPAFLRKRGPAIPSDVQVLGWAGGDLAAGAVELLDDSKPFGKAADRLVFTGVRSRPATSLTPGTSLELVSPRLRGAPLRAWRESVGANGTPGSRNSRFSDAPIVLDEAPARGVFASRLSRISVTFSEEVTGVAASHLKVNGQPALRVEGTGAGPYVFSVDALPSPVTQVFLDGGEIATRAGVGFEGDSWEYLLAPLSSVLSMPDDAFGGADTSVQVPISIAPGDGVLGIDMRIQFSPAVILATDATVSGIAATAGFGMARNLNTPGLVIISMYATQDALTGSGEIARLSFHVVGAPGSASPLTFASAYVNEAPAVLDHGLFTVTCAGAADGTPCNDGNACTESDQCIAGACAGAPVEAPGEIANVSLQADKSTLVWDPEAGGGAGTVYDCIRGGIVAFPVGPGGGDEVCVASGVAAATTTDITAPAPGGGFWYLVRAEDSCAKGTFGYEERRGFPPAERVSTTCP